MGKKQKAPLAVRLDDETDDRLTRAAQRTTLSKHQLMIAAIEAAIEAIEANDFRIVMPVEFAVKNVPTLNRLTDFEDLPLAAEPQNLNYSTRKRA